MGSGTSRLGSSRPPTPTLNRNNTRFKLSSLLCGASTSRSTYQMEEHPSELQADSATELDGGTQEITEESSISCTEATVGCSCHAEASTSSDTRNESHQHTGFEGYSINVAASSQRKCLSECKELVPPYQVSARHSGNESYRDSSNTASTSFVEQESSDPVSVNVSANKDGVNNVDDPVVSGVSQISHETVRPRSSSPEDTADASEHDTGRSGRRLFWDAFSRRSSRRLGDSQTIVFSAGSADDPGSQDRWLVDLGGDFSNDGFGGASSGYVGSRIHRFNERMRHSRSEIWERLRGGLDDFGRLNSSCPSGLHADGMCSCESLPTAEESSTRASISRIVMLAEALFEVLDEIHRQPVSLSLSMVSLPAPESVVDSFPLKSHKKVDAADGGNDAEQCYICLAEYEEGDQIRVLPCNHEYHMSCVDKWLKEIHGYGHYNQKTHHSSSFVL
ncbi:hypothetical protein PIB30_065109 [Stylosanthes scabra]|uniref:RING-type domain-containing protein n=1 Tax=Stylosanthes scabra TaxID=79078 RepID=A0ABU6ZKN4_9FABA|nr:hypothetical protein [Stylosanthes scabra]